MSNIHNERWLEEQREIFDDCVSLRNWPGARATVDRIEGRGFDTEAYELRREMNLAMSFEDKPRSTPFDVIKSQMDVVSGYAKRQEDKEFLEAYAEETGWDPRDEADRHRP